MIGKHGNRYAPGELIVKFRNRGPSTQQSLQKSLPNPEAKIVKVFDFGPQLSEDLDGEMALVKLPDSLDTEVALDTWAKDNDIEYVAPNHLIELDAMEKPSSQGFQDPIGAGKLNPKSWGLHNTGQTQGTPDADVDAPEAWNVQTGRGVHSNGPIIAVVDTGIDIYHEAIAENLWTNPGEIPGDGIDNDNNGVVDDVHGYDSRQEAGFPLDDNGHGTHCAAVIAAADGNSEKISGVMKRAQLVGVKFLSKLGMGTMSDAIEGLAYADRIGARIVSNSWGGGPFNPALRDVLQASPALHIFAAGNESNDNDYSPTYPANLDLPNVISVAATDHNDELAEFSNYGQKTVDIAAPGDKIYSAIHGGDYMELSGTSMAAPFVAGAAGLLVSEFPQISNEEIRTRLVNSVDQIENLQSKVRAGGRLNLARALERDLIAPGVAKDFQAQSVSSRKVRLEFRPSGDDGHLGLASRYRIRVSDKPITAENFSKARLVSEGTCAQSGQPQTLSFDMPPSAQARKLYFGLELQDNVGNASPLALSTTSLPPSQILFGPEESRDKEHWNSHWKFEQVDVPGRGKVWSDLVEENNGSAYLRSNDISLEGATAPKLVFESKYDLEPGRDFLKIEIGTKRNSIAWSWWEIADFSGTQDWHLKELDLSRYKGKDIRLKLTTRPYGRNTQMGVLLDNITVVDEPESSGKGSAS